MKRSEAERGIPVDVSDGDFNKFASRWGQLTTTNSTPYLEGSQRHTSLVRMSRKLGARSLVTALWSSIHPGQDQSQLFRIRLRLKNPAINNCQDLVMAYSLQTQFENCRRCHSFQSLPKQDNMPSFSQLMPAGLRTKCNLDASIL